MLAERGSVAAIIRMCYPPAVPDGEWRWRFGWFRDAVLPRLLEQREPCDVWVWAHARHERAVRELDPRVQLFTVKGASERRKPVASRFPWRDVVGLPRYPVQILLGSDDLLGPDFVRTALEELAQIPQPRALVTFQPLKLEVATGRIFRMRRYREDRPSPMLALRQETSAPGYSWVWRWGHTRLGALVDAVRVVPAGHALLSVHRYNDSTTVLPADAEAERMRAPWMPPRGPRR